MNSVWVHNLSPFAIQFTETFGIRWYGLSYLAGLVFSFILFVYLSRKGFTPLPEDRVSDFITIGAIGILAGGRIGYVLFYSPDLLTKFSSSFPFWGLLEVHKGGMASHGGIAGVILASFYFGYKMKLSKLHMLDLTTVCGGIGIFFGRIANFINGELYGRATSESFAWAVKFPNEIREWARYETIKLKGLGPVVESLGTLKLSGGRSLKADAATWNKWVDGSDAFAQDRIYTFINSILDAVQRGNAEVIAALGPVLTPRHPSQLYQALLEGLLVFILLALVWYKPRKPGVLAACFGFFYCIARIVGEQFRMPDAHIGFEMFGLTRGQILSFGLMGVALAILVYSLKQDTEPMGGWKKQKL